MQSKIDNPSADPKPATVRKTKKSISLFFLKGSKEVNKPELMFLSQTPLFRLGKSPDEYSHLLKRKDLINIGPILSYFTNNSRQTAFLAGDVVKNLHSYGRRKYRVINILTILAGPDDIEKYSGIMNNIISSNDGAFSLGFKYWVKKNRADGCFRDIALGRYIIEPRLEGVEKLFFLFRPAAIEVDLTTRSRFSAAFGVDMESPIDYSHGSVGD
jgi:hypothetical protein